MKKEDNRKAIDEMVYVKPIKFPWHVMRFFPNECRQIDFIGDQVSFGEDYGNLLEIRDALNWLVEQFGGKIKWDKGGEK